MCVCVCVCEASKIMIFRGCWSGNSCIYYEFGGGEEAWVDLVVCAGGDVYESGVRERGYVSKRVAVVVVVEE